MATKGWIGRQAILSFASGGADSDVLDLGATETVQGSAVLAAGSSTTNIITASIVSPILSGQAMVVTTDSLKGKGIIFRSDTVTANLRNQKRLITANTAAGVLTVAALTDAPAINDVFDITDLQPAKSYRRWDIQICGPGVVTATVNIKISNLEAGTYYILQSGAADIAIPVTANRATPVIPMVARFMKLSGTAQGQFTHFLVMGTTISIE